MEATNYNDFTRQVKEIIKKEIPAYLSGVAFSQKKITDLPTDALQVVSRKFVTLNGSTGNRPITSVIGQRFFDTTLNKPIWLGNGYSWVDSSGNPV